MSPRSIFGSLSVFCAVLSAVTIAGDAGATGPREFPDNGGAAFARSGAWLAVGTDPIAVHYNPAAMATARSGVALSFQLPFQKVCYDRRGPGDQLTGPRQGTSSSPGSIVYRPVCNANADTPGFVPSLSVMWRVTPDLGIGLSVVPPSAYGTSENDWPAITPGYNTQTGSAAPVAAPYRYMTLGNGSTVIFPTLSAGYEIIDGLRVGAGFVWGVALIDARLSAMAIANEDDLGDHAGDDSRTRVEAKDLFVPGLVASVHASPYRWLDTSVWYRWIDKVRSDEPKTTVDRPFYDSTLTGVSPICAGTEAVDCPAQSIRNEFVGERFEIAFPMEVRLGFRFHMPHDDTVVRTLTAELPADGEPPAKGGQIDRDPLKDDVFDVEVDLNWTNSSAASTIVARFKQNPDGTAALAVKPQGLLPPNGDRDEGYRDTFGVRLGGQYNVLREKLGLMAGMWIESAANDDEFLSVDPVVALRGGFGGGIVFRQAWFDFHVAYQRHWNVGYDNKGDGVQRSTAGTNQSDPPREFQVGGPRGADEFRSYHAVNGGKVIQSANVLSTDITFRF